MAEIIGLPKLSPTMEEGVLVKWLKAEGDSVEPGDLIAEVETDKANMDFTTEDEGVLLALLVEEGETVALGDPVAILGEKGEDVSDLIAEAKSRAGGAKKPAADDSDSGSEDAAEDNDEAAETKTKTSDKESGDKKKSEDKKKKKSGDEKKSEDKKKKASGAGADKGRRLLASPLAKTLAIELGIDLREIEGTGPGGRIVERDVRAAAEDHEAAPEAAEADEAAESQDDESAAGDTALAVVGARSAQRGARASDDDTAYHDEPLSKMRKRIASRLTEGKRDVPHFYLTRSFDAGPLLSFRKRLNELLGDRGRVSVNDLIVKGVALALRQMPACNASFIGDAIRYYDDVHIGVAVAIEQGLITPVVRNADLKGIGVIASEVKDLATRARDRRLKMHEIEGSTFTVSNLGMFGIEHFTAIINPPEAGILAVGAAVDTPIVRDGVVTVGQRMTMTMSCDHRVIDGALGARFMQVLVGLLEQPESLAL